MMIAEALGLSQRKPEPNERFPKACAGLHRDRSGSCDENLLGSFREETVGTSIAYSAFTPLREVRITYVLDNCAALEQSGLINRFI
jgi:hypothetical protein